MSASKNCPACLKQWADTFKFCPEDGALLVTPSPATVLETPAVITRSPAAAVKTSSVSDTVVVPAVRPVDTDEYAAAARPLSRSPAEAAPVQRPATGPKSRKGSPRLLNLEPVEAVPSASDASPAVTVLDGGGRRQLGLRSAPTVLTPSAVEDIVTEARAQPVQPLDPAPVDAGAAARVAAGRGPERAGAAATGPAARPEALKREQAKHPGHELHGGRAPAEVPSKKGSHADDRATRANEPAPSARAPAHPKHAPHKHEAPAKSAGHAAATTTVAHPARAGHGKGGGGLRKRNDFSDTGWFMRPDLPVDTETGRVQVDPKAYVRDDSIPEEKRRRFSLRRKDEE